MKLKMASIVTTHCNVSKYNEEVIHFFYTAIIGTTVIYILVQCLPSGDLRRFGLGLDSVERLNFWRPDSRSCVPFILAHV